ncbi:MAG: DNA polymerase III subunit delta [Sphingomonadales bacterium 32-67-7]|nr:MAG: DNA polymerase III subunit delta [Sphingomonadales bacterium 32-67-7]
MKAAKYPQMEKAMGAPSPDIRIFLLYGPNESDNMTLVKRLEKAMGDQAERIDLDGATLRGDPARLADEAASLSMFGDRRWIRVSGAGEESVAAIEALLSAPQAGNPVVAVAGAIKNSSKLAKLCLDHPAALAYASYAVEDRDAAQIVITLARERGLRLTPDLARRIADVAGNDRALIGGEVEKLALYCDAAPDHPAEATAEAFEALSAEAVESDVGPLVNAVFGGHVDILQQELSRMAASGTALASVTRPLISRAVLIGQIHGEAERGGSLDRAIDAMGRAIFWKDKPHIQRQARAWPLASVSRLMHRLLEAERATRDSRGPGDIAVRQALLTIARQAARSR